MSTVHEASQIYDIFTATTPLPSPRGKPPHLDVPGSWKMVSKWVMTYLYYKVDTPWKTNMSPENQWLEDVFPTEIIPF